MSRCGKEISDRRKREEIIREAQAGALLIPSPLRTNLAGALLVSIMKPSNNYISLEHRIYVFLRIKFSAQISILSL